MNNSERKFSTVNPGRFRKCRRKAQQKSVGSHKWHEVGFNWTWAWAALNLQPSNLSSNAYRSLPGGQVFSPSYFHVSISKKSREWLIILSTARRTKWTLVYLLTKNQVDIIFNTTTCAVLCFPRYVDFKTKTLKKYFGNTTALYEIPLNTLRNTSNYMCDLYPLSEIGLHIWKLQ